VHGVGVGCVSERKKLPSLHNNSMYVHPRLELAYVCGMRARARPQAPPENHGQRERREKEGSKARAWHHNVSKVSISCCSLARRSTC
jgi:hypothetical protein